MSKLLNTLLLSTALIYCSNSYSTTFETYTYDHVRDDLDCSILFNNTNCVVGNGSDPTGSQLGQLYYQDGSTWKEMRDEENRPYFDLATVVSDNAQASGYNQTIKDYIAGKKGGWNLIIKNCDSDGATTYTLTNDFEVTTYNTTLIIPQGITLTRSANNKTQIKFQYDSFNVSVLVLGNIIPTNPNGNSAEYSMIDVGTYCEGTEITRLYKSKVIIGPESNLKNDNPCFPVYSYSNTKFFIYPGVICENPISIYKNEFLYLNRFITENRNVKVLTKKKRIHVVYPTICKTTYNLKNSGNGDNTVTDLLPNVEVEGKFENGSTPVKIEGVNYSFEDATAPLIPVISKDGKKAVLGLNPENDVAKYDAKLWNECGLNEGKYSFVEYYNKPANKGNYFDVDNAYKLFYGLNKDENSLVLNTNEIFFGLLGNKNVKLNCEGDTVYLHGNNSGFKGKLMLPDSVKNIYFENEKSKVENIAYSSNSRPFRQLKHYYNGKLNWDLAVDGTTLKITLDNNTALVLTDSGRRKKTSIEVIGDHSNIDGIIITPPDVKEVIFGPKAFMRTVNISGTPIKYTFTGNNKVKDYNDYSSLNNNGHKVDVESNTLAKHLKNEKKNLNINVSKIHVGKNGTFTVKPGTKLVIGGEFGTTGQ